MATIFRKPAHVSSSGDDDPLRTYHFGVKGTVNESTVRSLVANYLGPIIATPLGVFFRGEITCDQIAYDLWDADIRYTRRPKDLGSFTWDLDGSGVTEHITTSLATREYPVGVAPTYNNLIGVGTDEITGVDVLRPSTRFSVSFTHPAGVLTLPYADYLSSLVGYVNSGPFFNWSAGEVRFSGVRANDGTQTQGSATYEFDIRRNITGLTIGTLTGIRKDGWEELWVHSVRTTKTVAGEIYPVRIPLFVYVERVAETIDFQASFGFG